MKLLYLLLPHLPLQTALLGQPELERSEVLLADNGVVVDLSADCRANGAVAGMALRLAQELCPEATVVPADSLAQRALYERALGALALFSPSLEEDGLSGIWCDAAGLEGLHGDDSHLASAVGEAVARIGLSACVGIGPGKFVSRIAAHQASAGGAIVVGQDKGADFLASLPVDLLPLRPLALDRLRLLGISTIGAFARLPRNGVGRRFGREAVNAHALANGRDEELLMPRRAPDARSGRHTFETAVEDREVLFAVALELLRRLCAELQEEGRAFRSLALVAEPEEGEELRSYAQLNEPVASVEMCRSLLRELTAGLPLARAVASLSVELGTLSSARGQQRSLLDGVVIDKRERARRAVLEVERRYGGRLRQIVPGEPHALLSERQLLLAPYGEGKTLLAQVARPICLMRRGAKRFLLDGGRYDEIVAIHARWRIDDWWLGAERSYYRVRTRAGQVCTLYRENGAWFIAGRLE